MSRLLCCLRARRPEMGAALDHPQGDACEGDGLPAPPTMADVIRERKKKAGGAGLGTLRRRIANATRRPRDNRPDRGCEHARYIRSVVSSWKVSEVFALCAALEAGAALRDLVTQAELAREPQHHLAAALPALLADRWWCDIELVGCSWCLWSHRAILAARSPTLRAIILRYPDSCTRIPLEGAMAAMSRVEAEACLTAIYSGVTPDRVCLRHNKFDNGDQVDADLDIVNTDNNSRCTCSVRRVPAWRTFGVSSEPLRVSMQYLLDSGEMSDATLVFRQESGPAAQYGFRSSVELPCHRAVLAASSRYFRSVMSRRGGGAVCVDEKVLPRRFARALLHAAYTDQVDLNLIGRNSTSPSSTNNTGNTTWARGATRTTTVMLDDAFQLYEIARFLEMGIVVQGCEDAIVRALAPDTLAQVLRWCTAPHASQWVNRQAMRYLRDEFVSVVSHPGSAALPPRALSAALASPFLQASEPAALRALLRWASAHKQGSVVWSGAGARRPRRRSVSDTTIRDLLSPLVAHLRLEHIHRNTDLVQQLVRRGILPEPPTTGNENTAAAWLGLGCSRPARFFQPYLDEIKALLAEQQVPEAELSRVRAKYMQRIPDTLYMVSRGPPPSPPSPGGSRAAARACVSPRAAACLRARVRELMCAPAVATATSVPTHVHTVHMQIALRAVREMSLPDACADLLLHDMEDDNSQNSPTWESPQRGSDDNEHFDNNWGRSDDCCRPRSTGSVRCGPDAVRTSSAPPLESNSRTSTCNRREQTRTENAHSSWSSGRLSSAVPDVAMAPNANTHLLTQRDYCTHPPQYGGVVLQLDLGDGATHTPRPGSRAQRNSTAQPNARQRDHAQAMSCLRTVSDEDELRAAIQLSVMRAYSTLEGSSSVAGVHSHRDLYAHTERNGASPRARASRPEPAPHLALSRLSPSPSTRRRDYTPRRHDFRVEGGAYNSASTSRGHSPNDYA